MKQVFMMCLIAIGLSGCFSFTGSLNRTTTSLTPDNVVTTIDEEYTENVVYQESVAKHSEAESERISTQATAIATAATNTNLSKDAQAILQFQALGVIGELKPTPYTGKAPTTWTDVGLEVAEQAGGIVKTTVGGITDLKMLEALSDMAKNGKTEVTATEGSTVEVNQTQTEATVIGKDNATEVVKDKTTQVVQPEEEEEEIEYAEEIPYTEVW